VARPKALKPTADSCILVFLNGGPSHIDMWDMKPDAPASIRGEFQPIATSLPGVVVCEHLPRLSRLMHHCTLIRSVHHNARNGHAGAVYVGLTGHDRGETTSGGALPTDYPAIGSVVGLCRPPAKPIVPFVSMPYITAEGRGGPPQPGYFGGWLGRSADPFFMLQDPNAPDFRMDELSLPEAVDPSRLEHRRQLARRLGGVPDGLTNDHHLRDVDAFQAKAIDLLNSPESRQAFEIEREHPGLRDAYGRNIYGQSVLLARRLIEAGSRVACISWAPDANATWDTHTDVFRRLKGQLLPPLDAALPTLLEDLDARGLLDRTLVVAMGEMGRGPKVDANAGRDHWVTCYTVLMAGGGIKRGYVHGSSDKSGGYPQNQPVTPADVIATIYHCLGIPHDLELNDRFQRPYPLVPGGRPITEILT
jgi:hypothetical protein